MIVAEPGLPTRRQFLVEGAVAAAALTVSAGPSAVGEAGLAFLAAGESPRSCCPRRIAPPTRLRPASLGDLREGNRQAVAVAQRSALAQRASQALLDLATGLPDAAIRAATLDLLHNPAPSYQLQSPTAAAKEAVRQELLAAGLISARTTVEGIFPPVADPEQAPQPVWSAPGSSFAAHHAYPGGLALHEWFNALIASQYANSYDTLYSLAISPPGLDVNLLVGPTLWHDIHKVSVFQWHPDGSELAEQIIADTGAHHALSGAEALVRGMPVAFVVAQLSAHDAPTNVAVKPSETGRQRLVNYLRAAAIIARLDPVATGLLHPTGDGGYALAQAPPHLESYIDHFADQDWVFTNDSVDVTVATLRELAGEYGIDPGREVARFNLFRNLVLSQVSDVRLYGALVAGGVGLVRELIHSEVDLTQLAS
jgi:hypothetical protein